MREKKGKDKFEMIDDVTYNLYVLVDRTVWYKQNTSFSTEK
jgi:hypothetical protein